MSMEPTTANSYISMDDTNKHVTTAAGPSHLVTQRFMVNIAGSMQDFESMGADAATWSPVDNCHTEIFGAALENIGTYANDHNAITNAISNAVIVKATMLQSKSTFPVPLGLECSAVLGTEKTETGETFLATILPTSSSTFPEVLFEADSNARQGIEWRSLYPQYNATNLEKQGVVRTQASVSHRCLASAC
jgi:hypothetical protein